MNKYVCMYKGKEIVIEAPTMFEAQVKGAIAFKEKHTWKVITVLAEKDGKEVVHQPLF